MELKEKIAAIAEKNLEDESHFLVDIIMSSRQGSGKVLILIDGDKGVNIDDCARLSRKLGHIIEEEEIISDKYILEVSSPGVEHPLTSERQYQKNIGRAVKVSLAEGKDVKGSLVEVQNDCIVLDQEIKKGKKKAYERVELSFSDISKTIVQISFK
ncbi:ribosome maturation factor RimP [Fulvivirga sp. M361]|uniref:ribosome maturation factor RimP n=1 Tax=Fulvivirga sp. M361 TaxID=2594266 RepID=UPI001179E082|nr:ribosome maturation factor RimP [Fulvivirga sp. M361]TRX62776.1 ribosome maturation factor RimP [Fulvivirga sp. M361]